MFCAVRLLKSHRIYSLSTKSLSQVALGPIPQVCVIGSGPAGFYTSQQILKSHPTARVDIYDKFPVPFGLVRFGVAPDHPEVKNVINTFTATASNERCSFLGNVTMGKDVSLEHLQAAYHAIIFCCGAEGDRTLGIPGESLANVVSARTFVGWYNGLPQYKQLDLDLEVETAVVIGHGNVALDVARILLSPISLLKTTDITDYALERLRNSRLKRIHLVGRRGPLQVAFTIKELRELIKMPDCASVLREEDFEGIEYKDLPRPRKRLTELMLVTAKQHPAAIDLDRYWKLRFLSSPLEILPNSQDNGKVGGVKFARCKLVGTGDSAKAVQTDQTYTIECGMVLRSIGYQSVPVFDSIPFDAKKGIIPTKNHRVVDRKGMYCSGWIKTGPVGVILTTMTDSFETGKAVVADFGNTCADVRGGKAAILDLLKSKGLRSVSFADWKKIDEYEVACGEKQGKLREKLVNFDKVFDIIDGKHKPT